MRAVIFREYGPPHVLVLNNIPRPTPEPNEIRIRVHATTVTAGDCELRSLQLPIYARWPMRIYARFQHSNGIIPGQEVAGEIDAVGDDVTRFEAGEAVFAATLMRFGGAAEYVCLPETYPIAAKPESTTFAEAATIPTGGINALHFLRQADICDGESVLINGAGGSIGTYAVQIATSMGADVTCVDREEKLGVLTDLGADAVVDYTQVDFTRAGETYDVIVDVVGVSPYRRSVRCLNRGGRYVLGTPRLHGVIQGVWTSLATDKRVRFESADYRPEDLRFLVERLETGAIRAIVDRHYPLQRLADAHRYVETGLKTGNVVVTVE